MIEVMIGLIGRIVSGVVRSSKDIRSLLTHLAASRNYLVKDTAASVLLTRTEHHHSSMVRWLTRKMVELEDIRRRRGEESANISKFDWWIFVIFNGLTGDRKYELQDGLWWSQYFLSFPLERRGEKGRVDNCAELGDGEAGQEKLRLSVPEYQM